MTNQIIDLLYSVFGNRLKGYRTKITAILQVVIASWLFATIQFKSFFCETFNAFCNPLESYSWWPVAFMVFGALQYILRKFTDTVPGSMPQLLRRFGKGYKEEVQKLRQATIIKK